MEMDYSVAISLLEHDSQAKSTAEPYVNSKSAFSIIIYFHYATWYV